MNFVLDQNSEYLDPFIDSFQEYRIEMSKLVKVLNNDFDVDNLIKTEESADKLMPLFKEPISRMEKDNFLLRSCNFNCKEEDNKLIEHVCN